MAETALHEEEYEGRLNLGLWRRILHYGRRHRRFMIGMVVLATLTAWFDVSFTLVTRKVINEVADKGAEADVLAYGSVYVALAVAFTAGIWTFIWLGAKISTGVGHDIRKAGFERLQELSFSFYDHRSVGWLMARMTSDCERLSNIFAWGILDVVWAFTLLSIIAVVMFAINVKLALVALAVIPVVFWVGTIFRKRILKTARRVRKANSKITAAYNEGIMGVRTSKVFVREDERADAEPIFHTRLPQAASDVSTPLGALPQGLEIEGREVRFWGPVYPGGQELEFGYELPAQPELRLGREFPTGAARVVILADADGPRIAAPGLARAPAEDRTIDGRPYRALAVGPLAAGAALALRIELPATPAPPIALVRSRIWLEVDDAAVVADEQNVLAVEADAPLRATSDAPLLCA